MLIASQHGIPSLRMTTSCVEALLLFICALARRNSAGDNRVRTCIGQHRLQLRSNVGERGGGEALARRQQDASQRRQPRLSQYRLRVGLDLRQVSGQRIDARRHDAERAEVLRCALPHRPSLHEMALEVS